MTYLLLVPERWPAMSKWLLRVNRLQAKRLHPLQCLDEFFRSSHCFTPVGLLKVLPAPPRWCYKQWFSRHRVIEGLALPKPLGKEHAKRNSKKNYHPYAAIATLISLCRLINLLPTTIGNMWAAGLTASLFQEISGTPIPCVFCEVTVVGTDPTHREWCRIFSDFLPLSNSKLKFQNHSQQRSDHSLKTEPTDFTIYIYI